MIPKPLSSSRSSPAPRAMPRWMRTHSPGLSGTPAASRRRASSLSYPREVATRPARSTAERATWLWPSAVGCGASAGSADRGPRDHRWSRRRTRPRSPSSLPAVKAMTSRPARPRKSTPRATQSAHAGTCRPPTSTGWGPNAAGSVGAGAALRRQGDGDRGVDGRAPHGPGRGQRRGAARQRLRDLGDDLDLAGDVGGDIGERAGQRARLGRGDDSSLAGGGQDLHAARPVPARTRGTPRRGSPRTPSRPRPPGPGWPWSPRRRRRTSAAGCAWRWTRRS